MVEKRLFSYRSTNHMNSYSCFRLQAADLVDGKSAIYTDLAQGQMDYILGGNPKGQR